MSKLPADIFSRQKISRAVHIALTAHAGQVRKADADIPYIVHPIAVALTVASYADSDDAICAAVLHDVLEDTDYPRAALTKEFGVAVVRLVEEVTDKEPKDTWESRRDSYLRVLLGASNDACLIACADKIDNVCSFIAAYDKYGLAAFTRFFPSLAVYLDFYQSVYSLVRRRVPRLLSAQLDVVLSSARHRIKMIP